MRKRGRKGWTTEEASLCWRLKAEGRPHADVAREVGRTEAEVDAFVATSYDRPAWREAWREEWTS